MKIDVWLRRAPHPRRVLYTRLLTVWHGCLYRYKYTLQLWYTYVQLSWTVIRFDETSVLENMVASTRPQAPEAIWLTNHMPHVCISLKSVTLYHNETSPSTIPVWKAIYSGASLLWTPSTKSMVLSSKTTMISPETLHLEWCWRSNWWPISWRLITSIVLWTCMVTPQLVSPW